MNELPAVMIVGPRACGKTTSARRHAQTFVRLDRPTEASPFRDDADTLLASLDPPVLLDEWQMVPEVLPAVKRAVDDHAGAGRFLLTGSVRAELLQASWAATGRVIRITQWGLCQRELVGDVKAPSFFDRIFGDGVASLSPAEGDHNLRTYVELAFRGGFPELAFQSATNARSRWLDAYLDQLLLRDASLADERRDPVLLRRYLQALATNTAGVAEHKVIYDAAGVSRLSAVAYDSLLELQFMTERIPAWHSNRLNRLTRSPKRYVIEPALLGPLLRVDARAVIRDGDLLGRVIDTFVVSQLRPEIEASEHRVTLSHLRMERGEREIDLLAEGDGGRVIAIEVKSSAAPDRHDARHIAWLRDEIGDRFAAGIVFHTGPYKFNLGDRIDALPISCLWSR
jgi:uncharacterized protein